MMRLPLRPMLGISVRAWRRRPRATRRVVTAEEEEEEEEEVTSLRHLGQLGVAQGSGFEGICHLEEQACLYRRNPGLGLR